MDSRKNAFRSRTPAGEPGRRVTNGVSRTCRSLYMCIRHRLYTVGTVLRRTVRVLSSPSRSYSELIKYRAVYINSTLRRVHRPFSLIWHELDLAPMFCNVFLCTITRSRPEYFPQWLDQWVCP